MTLFYSSSATARKCPELTDPIDGKVRVGKQTIDSTAKYECDEGFILIGGNGVRKCLAGGRWSGKAPICQCKFISRVQTAKQRSTACNSVD